MKNVLNNNIADEKIVVVAGGNYFDAFKDRVDSPMYHVGQTVKVYTGWLHLDKDVEPAEIVKVLGRLGDDHPTYAVRFSSEKIEIVNADEIVR